MQKVTILYDASQAVLSTFDLDEVLNQVLEIVHDYFHLQSGAILLIDNEKQHLYVRASFGYPKDFASTRLPIGAGVTGAAAGMRRPVYVPDVTKDSRYIAGTPGTKAELALPLMVRDEVVGVLDCQSDSTNPFDSETIDLLTLFATRHPSACKTRSCTRCCNGAPGNSKESTPSPSRPRWSPNSRTCWRGSPSN